MLLTKSLMESYRIYSLIINIIVEISTNVRCGVLKMSKVVTMLLPYLQYEYKN
jgi:hypothetical protein